MVVTFIFGAICFRILHLIALICMKVSQDIQNEIVLHAYKSFCSIKETDHLLVKVLSDWLEYYLIVWRIDALYCYQDMIIK